MSKKNYLFFALFLLLIKGADAANVGLLIMATGKYIQFVKPLISSADKYFCAKHNVTYFVFTDADPKQLADHNNLVVIEQSKLGWPYDTMMRFQTYAVNREAFNGQDYLFACDADMLFIDHFGDEILGKRTATLHPGFYNKARRAFSYESDPRSKACIAPNEGKHYFCGGFYGGQRDEFIKIAALCSENINDDLSRGVIAVWHDESHWNRYCIDNPPTVILSPSYCYPEGWKLPFRARLIALNKDHDAVRKSLFFPAINPLERRAFYESFNSF